MNGLSVHPSKDCTVLRQILDFFASRSIESFLVGGYLRDTLLDRSSQDIDIAVVGDSKTIGTDLAWALGGTFVPLSVQHRLGRVVVPSGREIPYCIDITTLNGSIIENLERRDFTIDAMALSMDKWGSLDWKDHILDPHHGLQDLISGHIRASSTSVFVEDPLRLIRAIRLSGQLHFSIDADTQELIHSSTTRLNLAAPERLREELLKIMALPNAHDLLVTLDGLNLLGQLIPELEACKGITQPKEHHWDVFEHSLAIVQALERIIPPARNDEILSDLPWDEDTHDYFLQGVSDGQNRLTMLKLAALLHDIAKPLTKAIDQSGRIHFFGHAALGAQMTRVICNRLRFSRKGTQTISAMVHDHLRPGQLQQDKHLPTPRAIFRYYRDLGTVATDTLYLNLADHWAARGPDLNLQDWNFHMEVISHLLDRATDKGQASQKITPLVTGHDLINQLELHPGPMVGATLTALREAQAGGEISNQIEAINWAREFLEHPQSEESLWAE